MVSVRCKLAVKSVLDTMNLHYTDIDLGEVEIEENLTQEQLLNLKERLKAYSLVLAEDKRAILVAKIRNLIVEMVRYTDDLPLLNFSEYLSEKLNLKYTHIANLFSEDTGTTVEQYVIIHKIEKVKELLVSSELTLKEISRKLHYSSVAHLCSQFKKVTGLTPIYFKKIKEQHKTFRHLVVG